MGLFGSKSRYLSGAARSIARTARKSRTLRSTYQYLWGAPEWSGRDLTAFAEEGYAKNPYVYAAINALVNAAISAPPVLYRATGDGKAGRQARAAMKAHKAAGARITNEGALLKRCQREAAKGRMRQKAAHFGRRLNMPARLCRDLARKAMEEEGEIEIITAHPVLNLMARPNGYYQPTWTAYMKAYLYSLQISGMAFQEPIMPTSGDRQGVPTELWVLPPQHMTFDEAWGTNPIPGFRWKGSRSSRDYFAYDPDPLKTEIYYDRFYNPLDPRTGLSPLAAAMQSVDLNNAARGMNKKQMDNGGMPPTLISAEEGFEDSPGYGGPGGGMSQDEADVQRETLKTQWSRMLRDGTPMALEGKSKVSMLGFDPSKLMWGDVLNLTAKEVAIVFDVPPEVIGNTEARHYNSYESARKALYYEAGLPLADFAYDHMTEGWLRRFGGDLILGYDTDEIGALQDDVKEAYERLKDADWLSVNEKRLASGHPEVRGGNVILVEASKTPLSVEVEGGGTSTDSDADSEGEPQGDSRAVDIEDVEVST